jgi:hypothetical protein
MEGRLGIPGSWGEEVGNLTAPNASSSTYPLDRMVSLSHSLGRAQGRAVSLSW